MDNINTDLEDIKTFDILDPEVYNLEQKIQIAPPPPEAAISA